MDLARMCNTALREPMVGGQATNTRRRQLHLMRNPTNPLRAMRVRGVACPRFLSTPRMPSGNESRARCDAGATPRAVYAPVPRSIAYVAKGYNGMHAGLDGWATSELGWADVCCSDR